MLHLFSSQYSTISTHRNPCLNSERWRSPTFMKNAINVICLAILLYVLLVRLYILERSLHQGTPGQLRMVRLADTVDIAIILSGANQEYQLMNFLKNLLYYQGRFNSSSQECKLNYTVQRDYVCPKQLTALYNPLNIHLILDSLGMDFILNVIHTWRIRDVEFIFYHFDSLMRYVQAIPDVHMAGIAALAKIAVPEVITSGVNKVILLDSDMLFSENINVLWKEFENFNENQIFGGALVQNDVYAAHLQSIDWPLYKLEKVSWHRMWMDTIQDLLKRTKNLKAADQDIYNAIFGIHPELFYQLPCTWNVQVIRHANINHCPVSWPVRYFDEQRCSDTNQSSLQDQEPSQQTVNLVHFCGDGKPVPDAPYSPENFTFIPTLRTYNITELRETFYRIYYAFNNVSLNCFV
ncbi:hypothetical protein CRM22_005369 [Opisthorchis felineus]|uniref:Glycosyltransferase-like protein LARGE2 n=1 Tax=Opisthorchis felineus TaxID=147828 RepID=A0A4S2LRG5_OPIFE|nr:hypothetical protein CRM22_005369 [Opisthorchis felineus]